MLSASSEMGDHVPWTEGMKAIGWQPPESRSAGAWDPMKAQTKQKCSRCWNSAITLPPIILSTHSIMLRQWVLPVLCVGDHLSGEVHQRHISYLMPLRSHPDSLCSVQACHHDDPIDRSQFFIGKKHEYNQPFTTYSAKGASKRCMFDWDSTIRPLHAWCTWNSSFCYGLKIHCMSPILMYSIYCRLARCISKSVTGGAHVDNVRGHGVSWRENGLYNIV